MSRRACAEPGGAQNGSGGAQAINDAGGAHGSGARKALRRQTTREIRKRSRPRLTRARPSSQKNKRGHARRTTWKLLLLLRSMEEALDAMKAWLSPDLLRP